MTVTIKTHYSDNELKIRSTRTKRGDIYVSQRSIDRALAKSTAPVGDYAVVPEDWYGVDGGYLVLRIGEVVAVDNGMTTGKINRWLPSGMAEIAVNGENAEMIYKKERVSRIEKL